MSQGGSLRIAHALLVVGIGTGCVGTIGGGPPVVDHPDPLATCAIDWNPAHAEVGHVAAVTDSDTGTVVFSDLGATVLIGGALAATDSTTRTWRTAARISAADGSGMWSVFDQHAGRSL